MVQVLKSRNTPSATLMAMMMMMAPNQIFAQQDILYTQYNNYGSARCTGQPTTIYTSQSGQCQIQSDVFQRTQCNEFPGSAVYQSQQRSCSSNPIDTTGLVQWYVARYRWTDSSTCATAPFSVEAVVGDAMCHPFSSDESGVVKQYMLVNCNGGRPIFKTCKDAGCSDCTVAEYTGECDTIGAGASTQAVCLKPGQDFSDRNDPYGDLTGAASVSHELGSMASLIATAAAIVAGFL